MSQYFEMETCFREPEALITALIEVGCYKDKHWTRNQIEAWENGQTLIDYHGLKRPEKANIIIRREHVGGASNDIGFVRRDDGTFRAIISEYDREALGYNAGWLGRLSQRYAVAVLRGQAAKRGMRVVQSQGEDGKIKLQLTVG